MTNEERIKKIEERAEGYYPPGISNVDNIWQILKRQVFTSGALSMLPEIEALKERETELEDALDRLIEAIPKQDNDRDWWPDELVKSVAAARELLNKNQPVETSR